MKTILHLAITIGALALSSCETFTQTTTTVAPDGTTTTTKSLSRTVNEAAVGAGATVAGALIPRRVLNEK